jgi:hypothetical protein
MWHSNSIVTNNKLKKNTLQSVRSNSTKKSYHPEIKLQKHDSEQPKTTANTTQKPEYTTLLKKPENDKDNSPSRKR